MSRKRAAEKSANGGRIQESGRAESSERKGPLRPFVPRRILRLHAIQVDRRENSSRLMKDQRAPLFIHARALNALAKCPFHPAGSIGHSRGRSNGHRKSPALSRARSRANGHFSRTLFFVAAEFCMRNSVSLSCSSITGSRSKGTRLHRDCMRRHDFSHERTRLRAQRALP